MGRRKVILKNQVLILENDNDDIAIKSERAAIVMALYYKDDMSYYFSYLSIIPEDICVYVISSNEEILQQAKCLMTRHKNLHVLEKENRGRDLSALLVTFSPYIREYDYLCFLHDKKQKHASMADDLSLWIENLWGNMIFSEKYIRKVITLLRNENYGVLLPPKPIGTYNDSMYTEPWDNNFENVRQLAQVIHLTKDITREDKEFVSLGSVFWCQTRALEKLFAYSWSYTDFPEEPMPDDGTISHAIERIFGFVAMDAGYETAVIMNPRYASKMVMILQDKLQYTYEWLWDKVGIKNTYQLSKYYEEKEIISKIFTQGQVYLYGAGDYGVQYLQKLKVWGYRPKGFVVSDGKRTRECICGLPVKELSEIEVKKDDWFIITTNPGLQEVLASNLEKKGYINYYKATCW